MLSEIVSKYWLAKTSLEKHLQLHNISLSSVCLCQTKMKQLEQEAHRAAGQIFLVTSNPQLRTVCTFMCKSVCCISAGKSVCLRMFACAATSSSLLCVLYLSYYDKCVEKSSNDYRRNLQEQSPTYTGAFRFIFLNPRMVL